MVKKATVFVIAIILLGTLPIQTSCKGRPAPEERTLGTHAPYLLLNQRFIEGVYAKLDIEDIDGVFWFVFSNLPDQVYVYPTENYYYFIFYAAGRQFWGNIRLPPKEREQGMLVFAYFEFRETPSGGRGFTRVKYFGPRDGVKIEKLERFKYKVTYKGKSVIFNLNQIEQEPPKSVKLREDEVFVERTFDESGYRFFLIFNKAKSYFLWILNEEEGVPDILDAIDDDVVVGRRSKFAFYLDRENNRKILIGVSRISIMRNDYYDGPFDQLADNYAEETRISEYIQKAYPYTRGRIDKYGYFIDTPRPSRVAISPYYSYYSRSDLLRFVKRARKAEDIYHFFGTVGRLGPRPSPSPRPRTG